MSENDERISALQNTIYERMEKELNTFIEQLEAMSPKGVMENAYELVIKRDYLMMMEESSFTLTQLKAFAEMEYPLNAMYQDWICSDTSYMDLLKDTATELADGIMQHQAEQKYSDPSVPPYDKGRVEASELGERQEWYASYMLDRRCCREYKEQVRDVHGTVGFAPFLNGWTEKYGLVRCMRLLSYSVNRPGGDTKYSADVRARAERFSFPDGERIGDLLPKGVTPAIIDASMKELMGLEQAHDRQQRPQRSKRRDSQER